MGMDMMILGIMTIDLIVEVALEAAGVPWGTAVTVLEVIVAEKVMVVGGFTKVMAVADMVMAVMVVAVMRIAAMAVAVIAVADMVVIAMVVAMVVGVMMVEVMVVAVMALADMVVAAIAVVATAVAAMAVAAADIEVMGGRRGYWYWCGETLSLHLYVALTC
jgi:hypothetical protein